MKVMCYKTRLTPVALLLVTGSILLVLLAAAGLDGCGPTKQPASAPPPRVQPVSAMSEFPHPLSEQEAAEYAGDQSCFQCHKEISALHARSSHAGTLKLVTEKSHGELFRSKQQINDPEMDYHYSVTTENGRC